MAGSWDIRRIYLYLVSFATLMMLIVGTVQVIDAGVEFIYPDPNVGVTPYYEKEMAKNNPTLTKEEIQKIQAEEKQRAIASQKYWQVKRLITSFSLILVAFPVYLYHWRKIQKVEQ
ncbi:MAG: hypothetical protein ACYDG6_09560 [Thermincolia bacterium]